MSQASPATVTLKGSPMVKELTAAGAITPGHLVLRGSAGTITVAGAAAECQAMFALENDVVGKDIDAAYASGEIVQCAVPTAGDELYVLIPAAAAAIVVGDYLQAGAGGTLIKRTATNKIFAIALEAKDNSAGGTAVRLRCEIV